jgi:VIT1/CCC1 family predicted Fe2+/Mn2+ transporter
MKDVISMMLANKRYIGLGSADGLLATLGTCLAAFGLGLNPITIGIAAAGGAFALSMTNSGGTYIGETATKGHLNKKIIADILAYGIFTAIGALFPLVPYFLINDSFLATIGSVISSLIGLIILGSLVGHGTKKGKILTVVEFALIGIFILLIIVFVGH